MPRPGRRPITQITPQEVLLALKRMERTKKDYTACSVRATCSQVFRYAIATARAERDVCADLRGALVTPKVVHRAAVTTPREVGALMRSIEDYDGHPIIRVRSEEHTSELQSLMRISYAVFCLKKKTITNKKRK